MAYRIQYIKNGFEVGSTVVNSIDGELADKVLNGAIFNRADDFTITEGTYVPHPSVRGAVIFTARS